MQSITDRKRAFEEGPGLTEPFDVWPNDKENMPPYPFPYLGRNTSPEWKLIRTYNISTMSATEFIRNIKVGHGYAFLADRAGRPVAGLIGEYKYKRERGVR